MHGAQALLLLIAAGGAPDAITVRWNANAVLRHDRCM
jgi:hypothetical protein